MAVTEIVSGPRVMSPPTRATPADLASSPKPWEKPAAQASSRRGKLSAKVSHRASAPIAARSDRFTASDFHPISAAAVRSGKWRPATRVSAVTTSCRSGGTSRIAASSPMPRTIPSPSGANPAKCRRISSNSPMPQSPAETSTERVLRATLSSTPLTNLKLSSTPPNILARLTDSLTTTRHGTSGQNTSS